MLIDIVADKSLRVVVPPFFLLSTIGVLCVGLQVQKVRANRPVTILKAGEDDAVFHLRHLGADQDRQRVCRCAAPRRIPGAAHTFANGARLEDVRSATGGDDYRLGAKDMKVTGAYVKSNRPRDPFALLVHQQMGHHDPVVNFGGGLAGGLCDDRLIAFAVDHDLPLAFTLITAGHWVAHDRQTPLLELMHRRINMAGNVVTQVLAHETHQVSARITNMVFRLVLVPLHAHVAVDGIQTLCDRAATLDVRLLDANDFQVTPPIAGFVCGPTATHAPTDDEDVAIHINRLPASHHTNPRLS